MNIKNKRGQLAIYIIVAILIVGTIVLLYTFRGKIFPPSIPADFVPVFTNYESCIQQEATAAAELAGTQGGRIDPGTYVPGSDYAPYSSHLNFLGFPVPYWYYMSGNGMIKENVPTQSEMQKDLAGYIERRLDNCDFSLFYPQGFYIATSEPNAKVTLNDNTIEISVNAPLTITKEGESARKETFDVKVNSKLGKMHKTAITIYNAEKQNAIFENYAVDVLRLYAPVDGVEIQCAPKVWQTRQVADELKKALEANMGAIKFKGDYYTLSNKEDKYFVVKDVSVDEAISLIYSRSWPTKFEVSGEGVDNELMTAEAVGNKEGLGIVGFCYVPYHFVYDIGFPLMVQITEGTELFQFPISVILSKNRPREIANLEDNPELGMGEEFDLCKYNTQDVTIRLYDVELDPIDANVSYSCFDQRCTLGETQNGVLQTKAPACVNGYLTVRAEGYIDKDNLFSSNEQTSADIVLDKEYNVNLNVLKDGKELDKGSTAILIFTNIRENNISTSATIPGYSNIKLSEGLYEITAFVYDNASITIPKSTKRQCFETSKTGILGFFGGNQEKCTNIEIPETKIDTALSGGGKATEFIVREDLARGKITINIEAMKRPKTIEDLANNFATFEARDLGVAYG